MNNIRQRELGKFAIGDIVRWTVKPKWTQGFVATGIIKKLEMSTFGGKKRGRGASIEVKTKKYWEIYNKKIAFVGVDKLTLLD